MVSKYIFSSLFLILIVQSNNAMETHQKPSIFSQIITSLGKRNEAHRSAWIKGYQAHSQLKQSEQNSPLTNKPVTPTILQKHPVEQDIYVYLWMNNNF